MPLFIPIKLNPSSIQGLGLFADHAIREGDLIWRAGEPFRHYHIDTIKSWVPEKQAHFFKYSIQSDDAGHVGDPEETIHSDPFAHTNHSCDPNTWWSGELTLVARRPIARGEEVTFDYATTEIREGFCLLSCRCGSPLCRRTITSRDFRLNRSLQESYGTHVLPHVLRTLQVTETG